MFSYEFSLEPENLLPQNRCFVRGFRQFSSHLTKCHACHRICTLSPLDAALPMRFAKTRNTTRLKCCACLPACLPATQNDFRRVTKHVWMSRSATPATPNEATPHVKPPKVKSDPFCRTYHRHGHTGIARTVANGCGRLRTVGQTPSTPDPQSETGTLATHSGKSWCYGW